VSIKVILKLLDFAFSFVKNSKHRKELILELLSYANEVALERGQIVW
jgi:hypothetical protein